MEDIQFLEHYTRIIFESAADEVEQLLQGLSINSLEGIEWDDLIAPALDRVRQSQSMLEYQTSRKILFTVIRHVGQWLRESGQPLEDTMLGELFIQKVDQNDHEAVEALLEAGADPNTEVTNDNFQTPFKSAVFNQRPDLVRLLLHFGADPTILQEDADSVFRALTSIGRMEIAWICLFHEAIGHAPKPLVHAFKMGAPDGSMEDAIAKAKLSEQEALRIFKDLLKTGQGRSAAAVICGYCMSLNLATNSEEATQIMFDFITRDLHIPEASTLGSLIHPLRLAGFAVEELSCSKQDQALCDAIRSGSADLAIDLLCRLDVRPLVRPDDNYLGNFTCEAITLALEGQMLDVILCLFELAPLPYSCRLQVLEWMITNDHADHIPAIAGDIGSHAQYRDRLLELAVEQDKAICLATLIGCGVTADSMHGRALLKGTGGLTSLLARSIPATQQDQIANDENASEVVFEDYHCAYVLLLSLEETWANLPELNDRIISARAELNDLEAVSFLCSTGYAPFSLLEACAQDLNNPDTDADRLSHIVDMLTYACEGLVDFLSTVENWSVQQLTSEALDSIIPEFSLAGRVTSLEALLRILDENETLNNEIFADPARRLLDIQDLAGQRNLDIPAIALLLEAIDETLSISHAVPSLQETARDVALGTLPPERLGQIRGILTTIHPEFIWEELIDRMNGFNLSVQQLIIMEALSNDPALAPLIFRDDPFFLEFNNDESDSSYSESELSSDSSD